jgi:hypothetical protein
MMDLYITSSFMGVETFTTTEVSGMAEMSPLPVPVLPFPVPYRIELSFELGIDPYKKRA